MRRDSKGELVEEEKCGKQLEIDFENSQLGQKKEEKRARCVFFQVKSSCHSPYFIEQTAHCEL